MKIVLDEIKELKQKIEDVKSNGLLLQELIHKAYNLIGAYNLELGKLMKDCREELNLFDVYDSKNKKAELFEKCKRDALVSIDKFLDNY